MHRDGHRHRLHGGHANRSGQLHDRLERLVRGAPVMHARSDRERRRRHPAGSATRHRRRGVGRTRSPPPTVVTSVTPPATASPTWPCHLPRRRSRSAASRSRSRPVKRARCTVTVASTGSRGARPRRERSASRPTRAARSAPAQPARSPRPVAPASPPARRATRRRRSGSERTRSPRATTATARHTASLATTQLGVRPAPTSSPRSAQSPVFLGPRPLVIHGRLVTVRLRCGPGARSCDGTVTLSNRAAAARPRRLSRAPRQGEGDQAHGQQSGAQQASQAPIGPRDGEHRRARADRPQRQDQRGRHARPAHRKEGLSDDSSTTRPATALPLSLRHPVTAPHGGIMSAPRTQNVNPAGDREQPSSPPFLSRPRQREHRLRDQPAPGEQRLAAHARAVRVAV